MQDLFMVDWNKAPKHARWWAIDADGKAHWYCEPDVAAFTNFWFSEQVTAPSFGYKGDYRLSLTPRPPPTCPATINFLTKA